MMAKTIKVLVVDDELPVLESFKMILELKHYEVTLAQSLEEAVTAAAAVSFDIAFIDLRFNNKDLGLEILARLKEISPSIQCIIVTAYASEQSKMEAIRLGALDYASKPFTMEMIYELVDRVIESRQAK